MELQSKYTDFIARMIYVKHNLQNGGHNFRPESINEMGMCG